MSRRGIEDYPELELFPSDEDRRAVMRAPSRWLGGIMGVVIGVLGAVFAHLPARLLHPILIKIWPTAPLLISNLIFWMIAGLALGFVYRSFYGDAAVRRYLRRELRKRGIQVCMNCGYSLSGNASGVCPECGSPCETKAAES